jgi:hypothetical protein
MTLDALLFLADERPHFVQFQPTGSHADRAAVVQLGATATNAQGEAADCTAIDTSQPGRGADADAFTKRGNDFDLFSAIQDVHGGLPRHVAGEAGPDRWQYRDKIAILCFTIMTEGLPSLVVIRLRRC